MTAFRFRAAPDEEATTPEGQAEAPGEDTARNQAAESTTEGEKKGGALMGKQIEIVERVDIEGAGIRLMAEEVPGEIRAHRGELKKRPPFGQITILDRITNRFVTMEIDDAESCHDLAAFFGALGTRIREAETPLTKKET
jgi:hypothetical protein